MTTAAVEATCESISEFWGVHLVGSTAHPRIFRILDDLVCDDRKQGYDAVVDHKHRQITTWTHCRGPCRHVPIPTARPGSAILHGPVYIDTELVEMPPKFYPVMLPREKWPDWDLSECHVTSYSYNYLALCALNPQREYSLQAEKLRP